MQGMLAEDLSFFFFWFSSPLFSRPPPLLSISHSRFLPRSASLSPFFFSGSSPISPLSPNSLLGLLFLSSPPAGSSSLSFFSSVFFQPPHEAPLFFFLYFLSPKNSQTSPSVSNTSPLRCLVVQNPKETLVQMHASPLVILLYFFLFLSFFSLFFCFSEIQYEDKNKIK